jgi:hypothetical protein
VGLVGLLMSLCGGGFSLMALSSNVQTFSVLAIALPSLFAGVFLIWLCVRLLRRISKDFGK